jgi:hypothetical protein
MTRTREHPVRWVFLALVAVTVTACGGGSSGSATQINVPNVVGDTQSVATTAITGAGLTVGTVTQGSSATVASGNVISQTPAAGSSAASGSSIAVLVSSGPASVSVPNVVGDTQIAAATAFTGAGLTVGTVTQQSSGAVASGEVISENPAAATSVATGSAVALVISTGPPTYTIGGTLIGLAPSASVNVLNGADSVPISANGSFTLPTGVVSAGSYSVTVESPTSAQTCAVQSGSGTVGSANVTNVVVYCSVNVSDATLHHTYTTVAAGFDTPSNGTSVIVDLVDSATFDGAGNIDQTGGTVNIGGSIYPVQPATGTYTVATTNALPTFVNAGSIGGIEGTNGDALAAIAAISGSPPVIGISVLPNATATTASINGNYTLADISAQLGDGKMYGYLATLTVINGTVSGTFTENMAGTITTGNPASAQWTVTNGILTSADAASGAVSADGDLIVLADTNSGDDPSINVAVLRGTGVTQTTFEGVYSVTEYSGGSVTATSGKGGTLFAYGNGTYSVSYTQNYNGTVTTNNTGTGTYTVASDGTLTLTATDGTVYNGAVSADGNALVFATLVSGRNPGIDVGVRQ